MVTRVLSLALRELTGLQRDAARRAVAALMMMLALAATVCAAETPAERDARMQWWREARFGMFIHFGLYSGLAGTWDGKAVGTRGGMEWIQNRVKAGTDRYAAQAVPLFRPAPGVAKEWAKLARQAGVKYAVLTSKHHEGFALFDSKVSDFDAGSVLHRDLVKEFLDAFRAEGIRVGLYHSVIDWHHPQYEYARSKQLPHPERDAAPYAPGSRNHAKYVDFLHAQVKELTSNYGPLDILWWDYSSQDFQGDEAWRAFALMDQVRAKNPRVVMNNRLFRIPEAGFTGMGTNAISSKLDPQYGDFLTPEQHIPPTGLPGLDWETCMTMNTTWGYSEHDHAWKSNETLIRGLIDVASKGGNLLLNIGPKGDGSVPRESIDGMKAIGEWLRTNGEAIYGTVACPFEKLEWGRCTQKKGAGGKTTYFLHVFDWPADGRLRVPVPGGAGTSVRLRARMLGSGSADLRVTREGAEIFIETQRTTAGDRIATVVQLEAAVPYNRATHVQPVHDLQPSIDAAIPVIRARGAIQFRELRREAL